MRKALTILSMILALCFGLLSVMCAVNDFAGAGALSAIIAIGLVVLSEKIGGEL